MTFKVAETFHSTFAKTYIQRETLGGIFLIFSMLLALFFANSGWKDSYEALWSAQIGFSFAGHVWGIELKHLIDEVLMTLFFLLIGCELKRAAQEGEMSSFQAISLPLIAALGGMVVPALLYVTSVFVMHNGGNAQHALHGWAIPTATDIAFALGILGFLGGRIAPGLKTFLMALAVLDDLGAILLIGLFYTDNIQWFGIAGVAIILCSLWVLNRRGVRSLSPYLSFGVLLWFAVHATGVHSTLSGVLLAAFIPLRPSDKKDERRSPLRSLEHALHPFVAFAIMPLFALANAGVSLTGVGAAEVVNPITLAIVIGLFIGKPLGVFCSSWLAVKARVAQLPRGVTWNQVFGVALLCGIGFTMSLFIGVLAFDGAQDQFAVRLGVLTGSGLSAVAGCAVLLRKKDILAA